MLLESTRARLELQRAAGLAVEAQLAELDAQLSDARRARDQQLCSYEREKRRFNQHRSTLGRTGQSIQSSMAAYLGETGLRQRSDTSPAATIRAWSKPPGYMALLVPVIVYSGYFVPWLVQQLNTIALGNSTAGANLPDLNTTSMEPASAPMAVGGLPPKADWTVTSARTALAAMAGVPLILGFMLRNQLFSQQIESALVGINRWWHGGATAASAETQDDDSVVSFSDPSSEDVREEDDVVIFFDGRPDLSDDESSSADADAFKDRLA